MDQQKKEKFRIRHKRLFVSLVAVLIAVITISSVISVAFLYVPPYTLQNSSREFTFTTNNSEFKGVGPWVGYYYVNGNVTSTTYLNQSKSSTFKISLYEISLELRQNSAFNMVNCKQGDLFYCLISGLSVRGHLLDNLHPTGVELHFYLLPNNGIDSDAHIINQNNTFGCLIYNYAQSVNNMSAPRNIFYSSFPPCAFSAPIVLDLSTKNVTYFSFFSDNYYNFGQTILTRLTFNTTTGLNSIQGQNFELCANLLGLSKKVTASIEIKIRVSPLAYITEESGFTPFNVENDVTNAVYAINNTSLTLPLEPYTNYTAFFYLNGTKEQYTFNSGPPFQDRILNANTVKPYFEWLSPLY